MLLMIDNYDSFTYNLVQYCLELGEEVVTHYNDQIDLNDIQKIRPDKIILSPGPGHPGQAGITLDVICEFAGKIPILGVCLGHQAIGQAFGGKVNLAKKIMHGKTSAIYHQKKGVFDSLPSPFTATRYHSLVVDQDTLSSDLMITACTQDEQGNIDEIMGIQHKTLPIYGVQFHPESILTEHGHQLIKNFLDQK